ncbi:hypothetical protein PRZ48_013698 [Zasmidium cellare]|uniref:Uncharacterized protein n=1 Tax=Zasmidium cellare TaxID=395010 RepID=A0ABR0E1Q9_ZASCE|nr:hypothetical protein PRZ48_013698 [Zasmidium cellare]
MAGLLEAEIERLAEGIINQKLTVFKKEIDEKHAKDYKKLVADYKKLEKDLNTTKQALSDLRLTLDSTSSAITNLGPTLLNLQAAVDNMKDEMIQDDERVRNLRSLCLQHTQAINDLLSGHTDILQTSMAHQLVFHSLRDALNRASPPAAPPAQSAQTASSSDHGNAAGVWSAHDSMAETAVDPVSDRADDLPTGPPFSRPAAQEGQFNGASAHDRHPPMLSSHTFGRSMISSNTPGEMSPHTAYTHQPTSGVADDVDAMDEADEGDDGSSTIAVASKRRAIERQPSDAGSASSTPSSLKRRRAVSNLRRASTDAMYEASSNVLAGHTSTTPMTRESQTESTSSGIQMPPWFHAAAEQESPVDPSPLQGWGARRTASREQAAGASRIPRFAAEPATQPTTETLSTIHTQTRAGRVPQPKKPFAGQTYYAGKVPDFSKGEDGSK